jgi:FixJ family two-component response regulator
MLHAQPRPTEMQETVFIVDDDEAVRDSLQWLIETEGYLRRPRIVSRATGVATTLRAAAGHSHAKAFWP